MKVGKGLVETLAERQQQRGVLDRREEKVLGLVTRTRWPSRDPSRKESIRRGLVVILVQGGCADARNAALIGLLLAVHRLHRTITHPDARRSPLKQRPRRSLARAGRPRRSGTPWPRRRPRPLPLIRRPSTGSDRRPARRTLGAVTLIAEDLLLLLLDDESGKPQTSQARHRPRRRLSGSSSRWPGPSPSARRRGAVDLEAGQGLGRARGSSPRIYVLAEALRHHR